MGRARAGVESWGRGRECARACACVRARLLARLNAAVEVAHLHLDRGHVVVVGHLVGEHLHRRLVVLHARERRRRGGSKDSGATVGNWAGRG
eukprot:4266497-Pleurochrysis_carterae.AAC.1